ncbi:hypothetical protein VTI74DRAFT_190 [Chaetomium olivicolor]
MDQTPEEELYAAAETMREAMKAAMRSKTATTASPSRKNSAAIPPSASDSSVAQGSSSTSLAHTAGTSPSSSSSPTSSDDDGSFTDEEPAVAATSSEGHDPAAAGDDAAAAAAAAETLAFDGDMSRYPASITSSVRDHVYEGGLRYHAYRAGRYAFPNDEVEQNRDDMKHTMTLMLCQGAYFYAPVEEALEEGGEVLDLGELILNQSCGV